MNRVFHVVQTATSRAWSSTDLCGLTEPQVEYSSTPQCAYSTVWGKGGKGLAGFLAFALDK